MRKGILRLMVLLLAVMPFLGVYASQTNAATSRVAVIKSMSGSVQVKKAGGSKQFKAFTKMSLNEGDVLSTGSGASTVLQFANGTSEDDQMTISANATLTFSKLSDRKGTRTKVSMFNGSAWVDVKSIATKNDEFTLETPTAVMGVRGTHFFASVDPITGSTSMAVAAGIVSTQTLPPPALPNMSSGSFPNLQITNGSVFNGAQFGYIPLVAPPPVMVYPTQQIVLNSQTTPQDLSNNVSVVDIQNVVAQASPEILKKIIQNASDIERENDALRQRLSEQFNNGITNDHPELESLQIVTQQELNSFMQNLSNMLGAIAREAVQEKKLSDNNIQDILKQTGQNLDYTNAVMQITEEQKKRQEELNRLEQLLRQKMLDQQQRELEQRNKELAKLIEELKKKIEEDNKKALEEKKKKAEKDYESQLSDAEKKRFKQDQTQLESGTVAEPVTGGGGGGGSSSGGGTTYVNPLLSLEVEYDTAPPSGSPVPAAQRLDVPLTGATYTAALPYVHGELELNVLGKNVNDHITVTSNGIPVERYGYFWIDSESPSDPKQFHVPMYSDHNEIVISVKSGDNGQVTPFTLIVNKPSLPEGASFTSSNNVSFQPVNNGKFAADVPSTVGSFDFSLNLSGDYDSATFDGYGSDTVVTPDENSTATLKKWHVTLPTDGYSSYYLYLYKGSVHYYFTFQVNHGGVVPSWTNPEWIESNPPFSIQTDGDENVDWEWNSTDSAFHVATGVEERSIFLNSYSSNVNVLAVWDVNHEYAQNETNCQYGEESYGFCLDLEKGDNTFKIYVTDKMGLHSYTYTIKVNRSDLPTGIDSWSVGYAPDVTASPTKSPLQYNEFGSYMYGASYYSTSTVTSNVYASLDITADPDVITKIRIQKPYDSEFAERPVPTPDGHVSFPYEDLDVEADHLNEYELSLFGSDQEEPIEVYQIVVPVGKIPLSPLNLFVMEEGTHVEFTGMTTRSIYSSSDSDSLSFDVDGGVLDVFYNGKELEYDDGYRISGLEAGGIYPITFKVYNKYHIGDPTTYTVTLYKLAGDSSPRDMAGLQLRNSEGNLDPLVNDSEDVPFQFTTTIVGSTEIAVHPVVPTGASILGVYTEEGPINKDINGDYPVSLNFGGLKTIYVVIQDGQYTKSIQVTFHHIFLA